MVSFLVNAKNLQCGRSGKLAFVMVASGKVGDKRMKILIEWSKQLTVCYKQRDKQ